MAQTETMRNINVDREVWCSSSREAPRGSQKLPALNTKAGRNFGLGALWAPGDGRKTLRSGQYLAGFPANLWSWFANFFTNPLVPICGPPQYIYLLLHVLDSYDTPSSTASF